MINVCLFQRKHLCRQVNEAFTELILCRVYICKSPNFEDRGGECSPPLILYMEKEKAKENVLGEGLPIYDGIDFASISFSP